MTTLTPDQQEAKDKLLSFLLDETKKEIILQGHAGTGKTFLINDIYNTYQDLVKLKSAIDLGSRYWEFLATTHKACESLSNSINKNVRTLHSYFSMNIYDHTDAKPNADNKILVIDECSYINYEQLDVIRYLSPYNKIIYMGDERQLAPVGLNHAPVFYDNIDKVTLSTTVRQQNAPKIAQYCELLRQAISDESSTPKLGYSDEIVHLDNNVFMDKMIEVFKQDVNVKALGCRNSTIIRYNKFIHKELTSSDSIKVGDTVVANSTTELVRNNRSYIVTAMRPTEFLGVKGTMMILDGSIEVFNPNGVTGISKAKKNAFTYKQFYKLKYLADMRLGYASTIHKAQGSTYDYVFLNLSELNQIKTRDDINRLLYVAFSRATTKVYVTGEIP